MSDFKERKIIRMDLLRVTPDGALKILEKSPANRNLSWTKVMTFVRDMKRGAWRLIHQGIAFNEKGELIDGQHRLWAVAESKLTQRFYAATYEGDDTALMMPFDIGMTRRAGDLTGLKKSQAAICSQMVRAVYPVSASIPADVIGKVWSKLEVVDRDLPDKPTRYFSAAPIRAAVLLRKMDGVDWSAQYRALLYKDHPSMDPMTGALFNRIMDMATSGGGARFTKALFGLTWSASDPARRRNVKFGQNAVDTAIEEARASFVKHFPEIDKLMQQAKGHTGGSMPVRVKKVIEEAKG